MGHHDLWVWGDLESLAARTSRRLKSSLLLAQEQYNRWLVFKGGDSDSTIATANGWPEVDVTMVRVALEKVNEVYGFANDGASPTQADRLTALRELAFTPSKSGLVVAVKADVRGLLDAMVAADEDFAEFKSFQGGATDAQSATQLNLLDPENTATADLVNACKVSLRSANQVYGFANNEAPLVQRDRLDDWRILT